MMHEDTLLAAAQRVLDRCPRPPQELPASDPMRLLYEAMNGDALGRLRAELITTQGEAEDAQEEADSADRARITAEDRADEAEEDLRELKADIAIAVKAATAERRAGRSSAGLNALIDSLGELIGMEKAA